MHRILFAQTLTISVLLVHCLGISIHQKACGSDWGWKRVATLSAGNSSVVFLPLSEAIESSSFNDDIFYAFAHLFSSTEVRYVDENGADIPIQISVGSGARQEMHASPAGVSARVSPFRTTSVYPIGVVHDATFVHCKLNPADAANWVHVVGGIVLVFVGGPVLSAAIGWMHAISSPDRRTSASCAIGCAIAVAYLLLLSIPMTVMQNVGEVAVCPHDFGNFNDIGSDKGLPASTRSLRPQHTQASTPSNAPQTGRATPSGSASSGVTAEARGGVLVDVARALLDGDILTRLGQEAIVAISSQPSRIRAMAALPFQRPEGHGTYQGMVQSRLGASGSIILPLPFPLPRWAVRTHVSEAHRRRRGQPLSMFHSMLPVMTEDTGACKDDIDHAWCDDCVRGIVWVSWAAVLLWTYVAGAGALSVCAAFACDQTRANNDDDSDNDLLDGYRMQRATHGSFVAQGAIQGLGMLLLANSSSHSGMSGLFVVVASLLAWGGWSGCFRIICCLPSWCCYCCCCCCIDRRRGAGAARDFGQGQGYGWCLRYRGDSRRLMADSSSGFYAPLLHVNQSGGQRLKEIVADGVSNIEYTAPVVLAPGSRFAGDGPVAGHDKLDGLDGGPSYSGGGAASGAYQRKAWSLNASPAP